MIVHDGNHPETVTAINKMVALSSRARVQIKWRRRRIAYQKTKDC